MIRNLFCKIGFHDYKKDNMQTETGYVKKKCSNCGEINWEHR